MQFRPFNPGIVSDVASKRGVEHPSLIGQHVSTSTNWTNAQVLLQKRGI